MTFIFPARFAQAVNLLLGETQVFAQVNALVGAHGLGAFALIFVEAELIEIVEGAFFVFNGAPGIKRQYLDVIVRGPGIQLAAFGQCEDLAGFLDAAVAVVDRVIIIMLPGPQSTGALFVIQEIHVFDNRLVVAGLVDAVQLVKIAFAEVQFLAVANLLFVAVGEGLAEKDTRKDQHHDQHAADNEADASRLLFQATGVFFLHVVSHLLEIGPDGMHFLHIRSFCSRRIQKAAVRTFCLRRIIFGTASGADLQIRHILPFRLSKLFCMDGKYYSTKSHRSRLFSQASDRNNQYSILPLVRKRSNTA